MATFRKRGGKWHAEVRRKGVYRTKTDYTKARLQLWAKEVEIEIDTGKLAKRSTATLADAFQKYSEEVSPNHKGFRWERIRLLKLGQDPLADVRFTELDASHLADFRDRRLKEVMPSSVNRELTLISGVITTARREWKWTDENPMSDITRPKNPKHRYRRISEDEILRICAALSFDFVNVRTTSDQVAIAFLFAIETAMRQGEIANLLREDVLAGERYLIVRDSKNNDSRHVPLSKEALRLIDMIPEGDGSRLFKISADTISTTFRRARIRACIKDLKYHDSRHEALTRMASKMDVLSLARVAGHRDVRSLMIYFNPTATELAVLLD